MSRTLTYRFEELPVGDLLADGCAEIDYSIYPNITLWSVGHVIVERAFDDAGNLHEACPVTLKAALYTKRRGEIYSAIEEAAWADSNRCGIKKFCPHPCNALGVRSLA